MHIHTADKGLGLDALCTNSVSTEREAHHLMYKDVLGGGLHRVIRPIDRHPIQAHCCSVAAARHCHRMEIRSIYSSAPEGTSGTFEGAAAELPPSTAGN